MGHLVEHALAPGALLELLRPYPPPRRVHGMAQALAQLAGEVLVAHHHVGLARQQQRQRVQVAGPYRGPGAAPVGVNHGHLGVQEAGLVLVDLDPCAQQRAIHRARRVVLHEVFIAPLQ